MCLDAKEDIHEDKEANNFNPLLASNIVTSNQIDSVIKNSASIIINTLQNLEINETIKSRYLLNFSAIENEDTSKKKKEKKDSSCCFDGCYVDCDCCTECFSCNQSESNCCDSGDCCSSCDLDCCSCDCS